MLIVTDAAGQQANLQLRKTNTAPCLPSISLTTRRLMGPSANVSGRPRRCRSWREREERMKEAMKRRASELSLQPAECKCFRLNPSLCLAVLPTGKVSLSTRHENTTITTPTGGGGTSGRHENNVWLLTVWDVKYALHYFLFASLGVLVKPCK